MRVWISLLAVVVTLGCSAARGDIVVVHNIQGISPNSHGGLTSFAGLVIDNGRVIRLLGDGEDWDKADRVIDGAGKYMLPGLIDAHAHVMGLGFQLARIDLSQTKTLDEALAMLHEAAQQGEGWIIGRGWNQVIWGLGRFPTATELDSAVADRPVFLERVDGHAGWANTAAMRAAGITRHTADPKGGRLERDAAGEPSGVFVDAAMAFIERVIPPPDAAARRQALQLALRAMTESGLTSVHDAGTGVEDWKLYREAAKSGQLTTRIYSMISGVGTDFDVLAKGGPMPSVMGDLLSLRAVKIYADGALGSRGAALHQAYSDDADNHGLLFHEADILTKMIARAASKGFQVGVHAIGDAANTQALDAFAAQARQGGRGLRHRIEHAQVVALDDIARFSALGVIASMQPIHATSDKNMAEDRIGSERIKGAYAWRKLLASGARLAAGSDFPVEPVNPFYGLHAAVTRRDRAGEPLEGWYAGEALSVAEALRAFTLDAAYAAHQEDVIGSLEIGKWADFIIVDRDIFTIDPQEIWQVKVLETWLAGERVFSEY